MLTALDAYLRGRYVNDTSFATRLDEVIAEATPLFTSQRKDLPIVEGAQDLVSSWSYAVSAHDATQQRRLAQLSPSTHCMILFALCSLLFRDLDHPSLLLGRSYRPPRLRDSELEALRDVSERAKLALLELLDRYEPDKPLVQSSTYGSDDPFTLTWMAEIVFRLPAPEDAVAAARLARYRDRLAQVIDGALTRESVLMTAGSELRFREVKSCFLPLRRIHLARTMSMLGRSLGNAAYEQIGSGWLATHSPRLWEEFDTELHRHLSFAAMGDARFDPSELAFALEGALHLHPNWVTPSTIERVLEGLRLSKDRQPFWRPITPLLANDRGHVLFLVSIEVANSILRSCEILDQRDPGFRRFSQIEPQLRQYTMWLVDEMEEVVDRSGGRVAGWRSDYEDKSDRDTIFLWYTSHVLVFLNHYRSLLKGKIGSDAAESAGLLVKRKLKPNDAYWVGEPLGSLSGTRRYTVRTIEDEYLKRRDGSQEGQDTAPRSLLLYGPPGTGKTMLAEQLAARLRRPLIVITVSDFLAAGAAELENRAKSVFEVLRAQDDVVVLFDEVDQFLLDRNSKRYSQQDDVFKFMTPGMLTKLQDLRQAQNCIFIVATNYYERIDSAIKRPGRLDRHFLLSLPDSSQRKSILVRLLQERAHKFGGTVSDADLIAEMEKESVLQHTALYGFGDLSNLVSYRTAIAKGMNAAEMIGALKRALPETAASTSLSSYAARFTEQDPSPFEEFFMLVYLKAEGGQSFSSAERDLMRRGLKLAPAPDSAAAWDRLAEKGVVEDGALLAALKGLGTRLLD